MSVPPQPIICFQDYFLCFRGKGLVTEYLIIPAATMGIFEALAYRTLEEGAWQHQDSCPG